MVDFTIDVFHSLHPDEEPPDTLHDKRNEVVRQLTCLQDRSNHVIEMFSRKDVSSVNSCYCSNNRVIEMFSRKDVSFLTVVIVLAIASLR